MKQGFKSEHWNDSEGRPLGGVSTGTGFTISWQHGPLGRDGDRKAPAGAFVEDVIAAVIDRIEYYQQSAFASSHNARALAGLFDAAHALAERTQEREARQVEGTHAV